MAHVRGICPVHCAGRVARAPDASPVRRRRPGSGSGGGLRPGAAAHGSTEGPADHVDHFVDVPIDLASLGRRPDAALDVVLEDEDRKGVDGSTQGAGLLEDIDAVFLALDHPADPADLALDPGKSAYELRLVLGVAVAEMVAARMDRGFGRGHGRS
jgi:hypothetical protein